MFYSFIFKLNISNDTRRTELSFSSATGRYCLLNLLITNENSLNPILIPVLCLISPLNKIQNK